MKHRLWKKEFEDSTDLCDLHKSELPLEKGFLQNAGTALGMASALAGGGHTVAAGNRSPASIQQPKPQSQPTAPAYNHQKMLNTIAQVESGGGKYTQHKPTASGHVAYGKYGLMGDTIRDVIKGHKDLKTQHGKALALTDPQLHKYMQDHKGLEDTIADRNLTHMEHVLGQSPDHLGYGWLEGTQHALRDKNAGKDISQHWHVKKIRDAYGKGK